MADNFDALRRLRHPTQSVKPAIGSVTDQDLQMPEDPKPVKKKYTFFWIFTCISAFLVFMQNLEGPFPIEAGAGTAVGAVLGCILLRFVAPHFLKKIWRSFSMRWLIIIGLTCLGLFLILTAMQGDLDYEYSYVLVGGAFVLSAVWLYREREGK